MQPRQLKRLIDADRYRPEPELIAQAMLKRHGVRELLTDTATPLNRAGRTQPLREDRPQAA